MQKSEIYQLALLNPDCKKGFNETCKNWSQGQPELVNCQLLSALLSAFELRRQGDLVAAAWTFEAVEKNVGYKTCWAYPRLFPTEIKRENITALRNSK